MISPLAKDIPDDPQTDDRIKKFVETVKRVDEIFAVGVDVFVLD